MVEEGVVYKGYDLDNKSPVTLESCAQMCMENDQCFFWKYNIHGSICFLKKSYHGRKLGGNGISGQKPCDPESAGSTLPFPKASTTTQQTLTTTGGTRETALVLTSYIWGRTVLVLVNLVLLP